MGTVIPRKRSDGSTGYQAQVLIKRAGKIVHREGRTFDRKQAASAWLEKHEKELAKPAGDANSVGRLWIESAANSRPRAALAFRALRRCGQRRTLKFAQ
jgi:hypothetical protein